MTHPIAATSPRRLAAAKFGRELQLALRKRQIGKRRLAQGTGIGRSSILYYCQGANLPSHANAIKMADALAWPRLLELSLEARRSECVNCGKVVINESPSPRRYCSDDCRNQQAKVDAAMGRTRKVQVVPLHRKIAAYEQAVAAMCNECESDGWCKDGDCPLRPVSPLDLREGLRSVPMLEPAPQVAYRIAMQRRRAGHGKPVVTPEIAAEILRDRRDGPTVLAARHGVSRRTVHRVLRRFDDMKVTADATL